MLKRKNFIQEKKCAIESGEVDIGLHEFNIVILKLNSNLFNISEYKKKTPFLLLFIFIDII